MKYFFEVPEQGRLTKKRKQMIYTSHKLCSKWIIYIERDENIRAILKEMQEKKIENFAMPEVANLRNTCGTEQKKLLRQ